MNYKLIITSILLLSVNILSQNYTVMGYYPEWKKYELPAEDIKYNNLTHIIHAFVWPDSTGELIIPDDFIYPQLIESAHANSVKVMIALGGWDNSNGFVPMISDTSSRSLFINNLSAFIDSCGYDGVDLDWEFPENIAQGELLRVFVEDLRNNLADSLQISIACNAGMWIGQYFKYEEMADNIDWYSIMAFEYHGGWSAHSGHNAPLYAPSNDICGSVDASARYFTNTRNIPSEKLLIGIPFYGKQFNASGLYRAFTGEVTIREFADIYPEIENGWNYYWDDFSKVPYLRDSLGATLITFDDTLSIEEKVKYVKENSFAGVMIWALGQDVVNGSQVLLEKVGTEIKKEFTSLPEPVSTSLPGNFELYNSYPNPFNPSTTIRYCIPALDDENITSSARVTLRVFDILGNEVATLVNKYQSAGLYEINFNAAGLSSGIYFYILRAGDKISRKKMILLK